MSARTPAKTYGETEAQALLEHAVKVATDPAAHPDHVKEARARLAGDVNIREMSPDIQRVVSYALELMSHVGTDDDAHTRRLWRLAERAIHTVEYGTAEQLDKLEAAVVAAPDPGLFAGPEGNARAREALEAAQAGKYDEWCAANLAPAEHH